MIFEDKSDNHVRYSYYRGDRLHLYALIIYHAGQPSHPSLKESFLIGDKVVPAIAHDLPKSPSPERIQMAAYIVPGAPSYTDI